MKNKTKYTMKPEYAISSETIMIVPNFEENGFLHSLVGKKDGVAKTALSPYKLIDTNLRFRGSSMRGAQDGSKAILDTVRSNPLILDRETDIILFPCVSPIRPDCVWLSLKHVKDYRSAGKGRTHVELSNESTIVLNVSNQSFTLKIQRAYELRYKMRARADEFEARAMEKGATYHLDKGEDELNYGDGGE
ncbi:competence protein ComK [Planococcus beigongshangi]|uniref:competence protein ComK n=1 Tax=Planococcus beigongshangi TaxID=2782536 RepID=UPI00193C63B2|nr:competence protein ComK [Planococcus beigongshangi]